MGRGGEASKRGEGFVDDCKGVAGGSGECVFTAVRTFEEVVAVFINKCAAGAGSAHEGGRDAGKAQFA